MTNTLAEHIKHQNELDSALFLGRLTWYTMSEMRVSHSQVVQGLVAAGLGSNLPPVPKDFDIFRRVSTNAQLKKVPVANDVETFENYLLRPIDERGENIITRRLVVESVNRKGKKLGYRQLRDIDFNRETGKITVQTVGPEITGEYNPVADQIVATIEREFLTWRGMLNSYAIREFVRKLMLSWGATCVRDGVYFLPEDMSTKVDAMDTFVNGLPGNASFHSMPLIDDGKQREMVKHAFQEESTGAIYKLMEKIDEYNASPSSVSTDTYAGLITKYQQFQTRTTDYKDLLETELGETESLLSLFQAKLVGLKGKVRNSIS